MIDPTIGNAMPFTPFAAQFIENPEGIRILAGARFLKNLMMERGHSEADAMEYIASCRRLEEIGSGYMAPDEFDTVLMMCKQNAETIDIREYLKCEHGTGARHD